MICISNAPPVAGILSAGERGNACPNWRHEQRDAEARAFDLLDQLGLAHRATHRPAALSGGERQRVAIARALINQPACVLMDEPTGNLDPQTAEQVLTTMTALRSLDTAFVVVTHDPGIAARMDRQLTLVDGRLSP